MVSEQKAEYISPEAAAQLVGVSRFAVMRALKAERLLGFRDNRGRWQIERSEVERWGAARPAQKEREQPPAHVEAAVLAVKLSAAEARAEAAEAERDRWRAMAEADRAELRELARSLADRRRSWWPF